ncbi:unnamed protein product [Spirodela intermedia]|uniref:Uncharacterized protein n=1 Tax=Spirodela intermedia TaxID=51605 RepID=A0A7I8JLY1_SPIIN|nr:unnamed protein product [Spirodela intermedia]CAA6671168.1 unnamed protein product [Spirodela intermedia]
MSLSSSHHQTKLLIICDGYPRTYLPSAVLIHSHTEGN